MKVVISAVPERMAGVKYILQTIPDAYVNWDKTRNAMDTFMESLNIIGEDDALSMEDDIILTSDFMAKAKKEIAEHPDTVIQFFSMRGADLTIGSRYENGSKFIANLCVYYPKGWAKDFQQWISTVDLKSYITAYDWLMADYMKATKQKYWIVVPNLVDHRIGKSAINPKRSSKRVSKTFKKQERLQIWLNIRPNKNI